MSHDESSLKGDAVKRELRVPIVGHHVRMSARTSGGFPTATSLQGPRAGPSQPETTEGGIRLIEPEI
jgi:hypothetical protein